MVTTSDSHSGSPRFESQLGSLKFNLISAFILQSSYARETGKSEKNAKNIAPHAQACMILSNRTLIGNLTCKVCKLVQGKEFLTCRKMVGTFKNNWAASLDHISGEWTSSTLISPISCEEDIR